MSISQDLKNAQKDLQARRPQTSRLRPISEVIPEAAGAPAPSSEDSTLAAVRSHVARLLKSGPVSLDSLEITHPKLKQAVRMARLWAERKRRGVADASLILCGDNGVGKTHIALAIWWSMCGQVVAPSDESPLKYGPPLDGYQKRPDGRFYLSNDLLGLMGQSRDPETGIIVPTRPASVIGYPPLIVIDDVGLGQSIPFVRADQQEAERQARFFKVINHCDGAVSVIITSNKSWPELAAYIGRRSADRLLQMAPRLAGTEDSFIVDMFGVPSWRRRAGGR